MPIYDEITTKGLVVSKKEKYLKFNLTTSEMAIVLRAMKAYGSLHRGDIQKELKPLKERLEDLEFTSNECYLISGALDSTYCFQAVTDEEVEEHRVKWKFYKQWFELDSDFPGNTRTPQDMIKQEYKLINESRRKVGLSAVSYHD